MRRSKSPKTNPQGSLHGPARRLAETVMRRLREETALGIWRWDLICEEEWECMLRVVETSLAESKSPSDALSEGAGK